MKIGTGNTTGDISVNAVNQVEDGYVKQLTGQIEKLRERIASLGEDKHMSPEMKIQKQKELENQIRQLESQIEQHKLMKQKETEKKQAEKIREQAEKYQNPEEKKEVISSNLMNAMVSASSAMSQAGSLNKVRVDLMGEVHRLEGAIAAEKSRDKGDPSKYQEDLAEKQAQVDGVTGQVISKYGEAVDAMKKGSKPDEAESSGKAEEKEEKEKEEQEKERRNIDLLV